LIGEEFRGWEELLDRLVGLEREFDLVAVWDCVGRRDGECQSVSSQSLGEFAWKQEEIAGY
jgi:hypothetical protein